MSSRGDTSSGRIESILSSAWSSLRDRASLRKPEPPVDAVAMEYLALGRRSNSTELDARQDDGLFGLVRGNDVLEELLDVPYALRHVKDLHAAMQLAVASVGERDEGLLHNTFFHPVFAAFTLGFAIGLATEHRAAHLTGLAEAGRLSPEDQVQCRDWGVMIALYYLVNVETRGVIDRDTDREIYGIADNWRLLADDRRLQPFSRLTRCVRAGTRASVGWARQEAVDMGELLSQALNRFIEAYPGRTFQ
jgi:hypothetical protein